MDNVYSNFQPYYAPLTNPPVPKKPSNILEKILTVLVLIVFAVVGFLAYQNITLRLNRKQNKLISEITPTPVVLPEITNSIPEGWENHQNNQWKYQINIPSDWTTDESYNSRGLTFFKSPKRQQDLNENKMVRMYDISVRVYSTLSSLPNNENDKLPYEDWIKTKYGEYICTDDSKLLTENINGLKAYHLEGGCETPNLMWLIENNGLIYEIDIDKTTDLDLETSLKIVNSFKSL